MALTARDMSKPKCERSMSINQCINPDGNTSYEVNLFMGSKPVLKYETPDPAEVEDAVTDWLVAQWPWKP